MTVVVGFVLEVCRRARQAGGPDGFLNVAHQDVAHELRHFESDVRHENSVSNASNCLSPHPRALSHVLPSLGRAHPCVRNSRLCGRPASALLRLGTLRSMAAHSSCRTMQPQLLASSTITSCTSRPTSGPFTFDGVLDSHGSALGPSCSSRARSFRAHGRIVVPFASAVRARVSATVSASSYAFCSASAAILCASRAPSRHPPAPPAVPAVAAELLVLAAM